jgi:transposase
MQLNYLTNLLGMQGYSISDQKIEPRRGQPAVILTLKRTRHDYECGQCHRRFKTAHSSWWLEVQHLMLWQFVTFLRVKHYRVKCPICGVTQEPVPFVSQEARVTRSLAALVVELCKVLSVKAVALLCFLHRSTVRTIDKQTLQKQQAERPLDGITVLGADEIAVGKGQHYWTMISALEGPRGKELLMVVNGRKEKHLRPFWKWFGRERAQQITHAVMDMWRAFRNSFKAHCPKVQIIYDEFHIIRHLLEALNEVRKAEFKRAGKRFRGLLAGKKFILLSRQAHVRGNARVALNQVLKASKRLFKAHLLKESFGQLWSYRSKTWARKFFQGWREQLKWSRLKPYQKFVALVEKHLDGILAYCDKPVSLGYLEGINLKAKNLIRRAYGYRDEEYMKLKLIQTCTAWMGEFKPWVWAHKIPS